MPIDNKSPQWRVYAFVCHWSRIHNGQFPTYRQIVHAVGFTTTSVVGDYLRDLVRAGLLDRHVTNNRRCYSIAGQCVLLPGAAVQAAAEWVAQGEMTR